MLKVLSDGSVLIYLKKCAKCRQEMTELFKIPMKEETNYVDLIMKIIRDNKDKILKVDFDEFVAMCPSCKEEKEDITFIKASPEELETLNQTPLAKMWLTTDL